MDLHIQGGRPPSARPQSRINPITGEEMMYTARTPRQAHYQDNQKSKESQFRPQGVPALNLSAFQSRDDDTDITLQIDQYNSPKVGTPNTAVSWGTPSSAYNSKSQYTKMKQQKVQDLLSQRESGRINSGRLYHTQNPPTPKQPTAWDRDPVPQDVPPPSQRHKEQYRQYEQEMIQAYKKKSQPLKEDEIMEKVERLKLDLPLCPSGEDEVDDKKDLLQKDWTQQPYTKAALRKKSDWEHLEEEKKTNKLIETVMIDQLSRPVISRPEQNEVLSSKPQMYRPGMKRGSVRTMHDTKVRTDGSSTENLLSRRVRFGARVLTQTGRDAIRELTGFFFVIDNSLTIYEFRQFGKSAKAMPFIKRGSYEKLSGKHKGELFSLTDIVQGGELEFETRDQPFPDSMKETEIAHLKITDVDDEAKGAILLHGIGRSERDETWKKLHMPTSREELQSRILMQEVQALVRKQINKRGIKVYTGLGRQLRKASREEADGKLNKYELEKALCDFHIDIPNEKLDDLWEYLDKNGTSFMEYDVFLRGFLGEMSERRKHLVRKAFRKIDAGKRGVVSIDELRKFYNAHKHPKVKSGECTEDEVRQMFLANFSDTNCPGEITYEEFGEYYEGLSVCVVDDDDFENILKNAWSI